MLLWFTSRKKDWLGLNCSRRLWEQTNWGVEQQLEQPNVRRAFYSVKKSGGAKSAAMSLGS